MTSPLSFTDAMGRNRDGLLPAAFAGRPVCVVVGNFDGVHIAHQRLLSKGKETGLPVVALTFDPHPRKVLCGTAPARLSDNGTRDELLRRFGADAIVLLAFSKDFADMSAEAFVRDILVARLHAGALVFGHDFKLGKDGTGDAASLQALGNRYRFAARQLDRVQLDDGTVISSTAVRAAVAKGNMERAERLLGRRYELRGNVVHGAHRGRGLGFPTANIDIHPSIQLPAPGVYATDACFDGRRYRAATNVGTNPTFHNPMPTVETHIPDFHGNLYGTSLRVEFKTKLRDETAFDSIDALKIQLASDVRKAERL